jgi:hypothetical protein
LHLDLIEFTGRLIGFPLVNGVYLGLFLSFVYLLCLDSLGPKGECWHEIWPSGFGGVRGLTAPIGLRQWASGRWLVAPMGLACPHAEEEASALVVGFGLGCDTRLCRVWSFLCIRV